MCGQNGANLAKTSIKGLLRAWVGGGVISHHTMSWPTNTHLWLPGKILIITGWRCYAINLRHLIAAINQSCWSTWSRHTHTHMWGERKNSKAQMHMYKSTIEQQAARSDKQSAQNWSFLERTSEAAAAAFEMLRSVCRAEILWRFFHLLSQWVALKNRLAS